MLLWVEEKGEQGSGFHVGKPGDSQVAEKEQDTGTHVWPTNSCSATRDKGTQEIQQAGPLLGGLLPGARVAVCRLWEQPFHRSLSGRKGEGHRFFLHLLFHNNQLKVSIPKGTFWGSKLWSPSAGKHHHVFILQSVPPLC